MAGGFMNGGSGKGWGAKRSGGRPMSEINVTPMVDVMLVLLIIFMVAAPLLTVGVKVDLPETKAQAIAEDVEPLAVTIDEDRKIFVQETEVELEKLAPLLKEVARNNYDLRIFVRADQSVDYGTVMTVMGELNSAGFKRLAFPTNQAPKVEAGATE
ncbi:MAG: protein TolR [Alphaproteobacteria bacterium]